MHKQDHILRFRTNTLSKRGKQIGTAIFSYAWLGQGDHKEHASLTELTSTSIFKVMDQAWILPGSEELDIESFHGNY